MNRAIRTASLLVMSALAACVGMEPAPQLGPSGAMLAAPQRALVVEGNVAVSTAELSEACEAGAIMGGATEASQCLSAVYYDHGYLGVELTQAPGDPNAHSLTVRFTVVEGPRYRLGRVGAHELDDRDSHEVEMLGGRRAIEEQIHFASGDWFSRRAVADDFELIRTLYRDAGYACVSVIPEMIPHSDRHEVDITVRIMRGPLVTVDRINLHGDSRASESSLRALVSLREGALYNETAVQRTRSALLATGAFDRVDISTEAIPGAEGRVYVNIELVERAR